MIGHRQRSRAMAPARDPDGPQKSENAYFGLLYHNDRVAKPSGFTAVSRSFRAKPTRNGCAGHILSFK
eukprot:2353977-Prymnesium_polylepis.1